jgi:hypothetical protein
MAECPDETLPCSIPIESRVVAGSGWCHFCGGEDFGGNLNIRVHSFTYMDSLPLLKYQHGSCDPTHFLPGPYHSASMLVRNVDAHQLCHVRQKGGA